MTNGSRDAQDNDGFSLLFKQMLPFTDERAWRVGMREEEEGLGGSGEDHWLVKLLLREQRTWK